jgi:hypothetical protein
VVTPAGGSFDPVPLRIVEERRVYTPTGDAEQAVIIVEALRVSGARNGAAGLIAHGIITTNVTLTAYDFPAAWW